MFGGYIPLPLTREEHGPLLKCRCVAVLRREAESTPHQMCLDIYLHLNEPRRHTHKTHKGPVIKVTRLNCHTLRKRRVEVCTAIPIVTTSLWSVAGVEELRWLFASGLAWLINHLRRVSDCGVRKGLCRQPIGWRQGEARPMGAPHVTGGRRGLSLQSLEECQAEISSYSSRNKRPSAAFMAHNKNTGL